MCTHKKQIVSSTGVKYYVDCGKCPSCLQTKADKRSRKIRNNVIADGKHLVLFVTLTYENRFIPYVRRKDFLLENRSKRFPNKIRVFRDATIRKVRVKTEYGMIYDYKEYSNELMPGFTAQHFDRIDMPFSYINTDFEDTSRIDELKPLRGQPDKDKIGIIYYKDVQNFVKRLRTNLERIYSYDKPISLFTCAEYGPTTCRPHFHLLIQCETEGYEVVKHAIGASWKYCDPYRLNKYIEVAQDCASYVSSYVNGTTSLPYLFQQRNFKQKHSHSKGFGFANAAFGYEAVCKSVRDRSFRYDIERVDADGVAVVSSVPLPRYVLHHYFPKCRSFGKLSDSEIREIYARPERLVRYARRLGYDTTFFDEAYTAARNGFLSQTPELHESTIEHLCRIENKRWMHSQLRRDIMMIRNARKRIPRWYLSDDDYGEMVADCYRGYSSMLLKYLHEEDKNVVDSLSHYDNMHTVFNDRSCFDDRQDGTFVSKLDKLPRFKSINDVPIDFDYGTKFNPYSHIHKDGAFKIFDGDIRDILLSLGETWYNLNAYDANKNADNIRQTGCMTQRFYRKVKQKKQTNYAMASLGHNV